jgi:hypothetical protein
MKPQNFDDMKFCNLCKMNVFPTRPPFNVKLFILFFIIVSITFIPLIILSLPYLTAWIIVAIFLTWGFLVINPYLIIYGLKKKQYCPNCYQLLNEKNLEYQPFGEKVSEIYEKIAPKKYNKSEWFCPYCGNRMSKKAKFCHSCGKKCELKFES